MINYSQCWEDAEVTIKALKPTEGDTILSVTSGGCNALALASYETKMVFALDSNASQNYLLEFKLAALKLLKYEQVLQLLGYSPTSQRIDLYRIIEPSLTGDAQIFWSKNLSAIRKGVVHSGKFERYLWAFRNLILPCVHTKMRVNELLNPASIQHQQTFYNKSWNTKRWRMIFNIFFSRKVMSGRGRSKEMFSHSHSVPTAQLLFHRTEYALKFGNVSNNFYLSYILLGKKNTLRPFYLNEDLANHIKIKNNITVVNNDIHTFLCQMPDNSIDKFNLSDIFEPLTIEKSNSIFTEIARTAKPGARIIFWNNLVYRDVPESLKDKLVRDFETEKELKSIDRVFFYERFYVYSVKSELE